MKYLRYLPPSSHQSKPVIPAKNRQIPNANRFLAQKIVNTRHTINMIAAPLDAVTLNAQNTRIAPRKDDPRYPAGSARHCVLLLPTYVVNPPKFGSTVIDFTFPPLTHAMHACPNSCSPIVTNYWDKVLQINTKNC